MFVEGPMEMMIIMAVHVVSVNIQSRYMKYRANGTAGSYLYYEFVNGILNFAININ